MVSFRGGHNRHYFFYKPFNPELVEYYIFKVLFSISESFADLFLPIFLYAQLEYSLFQIMVFYIINQFFFIVATPFTAVAVKRIGIKHTIAFHIPFMAVFWYLLRYLPQDFFGGLWIVFGILALRAIPRAFYNTSEMIFISKNVLLKKHYGSRISQIKIMLIFASLLAPLIGGLITYFFGFDMLFNAGIIIALLSGIALLLTPDKHFKVRFSPGEVCSYSFNHLPRSLKIAEIGRVSPELVLWVLWPIFLYITLENTASLGLLVFISSSLAMIVAHQIGKWSDKKNPKKILNYCTKISAIVYFIRVVFINPFLIGFTDTINRILFPMVRIPYDKFIYQYITKSRNFVQKTTAYLFYSEIIWTIIFIILALIFKILEIYNFDDNYFTFLIIFIIFGLPILLMQKIAEINK